ncbi:MAG: hypothetical protein GY833_24715 [Aestuariibacter sp.]|nr:hypothetical protein [Aestuariibacter sp.]
MNKLIIMLIFLLIMLTACCNSATEIDSTSPGNSFVQVTEIVPAATSEGQKVSDGERVLPFARSDIIPGQTTRGEVRQIMGDPVSRSYFGTWSYSYNVPNHTSVMSFWFNEKSVVIEIWIPISDFSLGSLIDQLGDPEIVELRINQPDVGPPIYPDKVFHFPSLGVSYYAPCIVDNVNLGKDCQQHYPTDTIELVVQYVSSSQLEFRQEIAPDSVVIDWQGFQE